MISDKLGIIEGLQIKQRIGIFVFTLDFFNNGCIVQLHNQRKPNLLFLMSYIWPTKYVKGKQTLTIILYDVYGTS